jgi:hypothetical protein
MTEDLIPVSGEDYADIASALLRVCEGHRVDLALAAAAAVVARLIGTHSESESAALGQAKHIGKQIAENAKIDWLAAHQPDQKQVGRDE